MGVAVIMILIMITIMIMIMIMITIIHRHVLSYYNKKGLTENLGREINVKFIKILKY